MSFEGMFYGERLCFKTSYEMRFSAFIGEFEFFFFSFLHFILFFYFLLYLNFISENITLFIRTL